jgi:hypothetical protein
MIHRLADLRAGNGRSARRLTLALLILGCSLWGSVLPRAASAETAGSFQVTVNPGGGTIVSGTLGNSPLPAATATLLRRVHTELGSRPAVVQTVQDTRDHSLALLFTAGRGSASYTGLALVTGNPGAQVAGVALYDLSKRFPSTVGPMLRKFQGMTVAAKTPGAPAALAPPERLISHAFSDGTGSIGVPADWTLGVAGGGSAQAGGPANSAQVSYNIHFTGIDPSNPRAQMFLRTATPLALQNLHGAVLAYTSNPADAWVAMYKALARQRGLAEPQIHLTSTAAAGSGAANIAGTLGTGPKAIHFMAFVFVLPPNPNGMWSISDSHIFVTEADIAREALTANAVLDSVRINFGAVAAQQDAIRQSFQKRFESEIANDKAQDAARAAQTDQALANDRAAQEGMHKQAVAMENYSLDRAVVVNTTTGQHSTLDSNFAQTLVHDNPNYQKVPAESLLSGVDY